LLVRFVPAVLVCSLLAGWSPAQNLAWAPAGSTTEEGNGNNSIPFWSQSATYQQIHGHDDMAALNNGQVMVITALHFRKDFGSAASPARTVDVQLVVGNHVVSAQSPSSSFASNLGANPTVVLPWGPLNLPALNDAPMAPNQAGITLPFQTPHPWLPVPGNAFVWEWRHRNLSIVDGIVLDAADGNNSIYRTPLGTGCTASGQTRNAHIAQATLDISTGNASTILNRGPASAPTVAFLGFQSLVISLPGFCSSLETLPVVSFSGMTDATGVWDLRWTAGNLHGVPRVTIYTQFAFLDSTLPFGLGLSDCSRLELPLTGVRDLARIWFGSHHTGAGNETATHGIPDPFFGLVAGFSFQ
jgi:hypothetical protein